MLAQATINLSVLVAFRDREPERVKRFLAALDQQSFRNFELVFLDYGSKDTIAQEVRKLVSQYRWARYVFNETTRMPWNRSHALNSAARVANGEYFLCTDIDLIYSSGALARLVECADQHALVGAPFFLLPKRFNAWSQLTQGKLSGFAVSHPNTLGAIQLLSRNAFFSVKGLDEFFCIWGVEDLDFRARLQLNGIPFQKIETLQIYHQWHPSAAMPEMPIGWLEVMNFHSLVGTKPEALPQRERGYCYSKSDRPSLSASSSDGSARRYYLPSKNPKISDFSAWSKITFIRTFLGDLISAKPEEVFICYIDHSKAVRFKEFAARTIFRLRFRPVSGKRLFEYRTESAAILWYIIRLSGLLKDYSINRGDRIDEYVLVRR